MFYISCCVVYGVGVFWVVVGVGSGVNNLGKGGKWERLEINIMVRRFLLWFRDNGELA